MADRFLTRLSILCLCLLILLSACSTPTSKAPRPTAVAMPAREVIGGILQSARQAAAQGRYERAISLYRRVQESYPDAPERPEATLLLAQTLEANGDTASALSEYRRLTTEYAQSPQAVLARNKIPNLERELGKIPPTILAQVVGTYVGSGAIESLDESELGRLRRSGINTIVVEIAPNPTPLPHASYEGAGVYFKTGWAPVLKDELGALVGVAHRQGIQVWAAVSIRRMDWIDRKLNWSDWRYNVQTLELTRSDAVDLLHPGITEYLLGFFSDLAASGVDGVWVTAEPSSGASDGFSPSALRRYERDIGQSVDLSRFRLGQDRALGYAPEFWRWIGWKEREQVKALDGVLRAVRKSNPSLKVAIELHAEAVTSPRAALAWYAEDLLDLKRYRFEYLVLPSVPALGPWIAQQTDRKRFLLTLDATPGAPAPSLIPRDIGLIYKEKPQPAGLTNQGR